MMKVRAMPQMWEQWSKEKPRRRKGEGDARVKDVELRLRERCASTADYRRNQHCPVNGPGPQVERSLAR